MAGRVEIERKVRQLDNDVQAIYEMLATITATQNRHSNRLDEIAATQADHGQILGDHGQKLDDFGRRLDDHGRILNDHGQKLDDLGRRLDDQGQKLDAILDLLRGNQAR